jgi:hypothetical protein
MDWMGRGLRGSTYVGALEPLFKGLDGVGQQIVAVGIAWLR